MAEIDRAASEPMEVLIRRAAFAVAVEAKRMLRARRSSGCAGARVVVIAGKGNNGADGRVAAALLERAGARCLIVEADVAGVQDLGVTRAWASPDLLLDAAYGTGFRGQFVSPIPSAAIDCPVLAVDIPSGVDGLTGAAGDGVIPADVTVTFVAVKPGLLMEPGRSLAGRVVVADIGLAASEPTAEWSEAHDLGGWPQPLPTAHKWQRAVRVVGGGAHMMGAPAMTASAALRAGAGYVTLSSPVADSTMAGHGPAPIEAVYRPLPTEDWGRTLANELASFGALVLGPGLAPTEHNMAEVRSVLSGADGDVRTPAVIDAGALDAIGPEPILRPAILTPHAGEQRRLLERCGWNDLLAMDDRIAQTKELADRLGCVVLSKGATTVVADSKGRAMVVTSGDGRLATAGTGDVLAGVIGAGLAAGLAPFDAAWLGAELHAQAARLGQARGLVASDLPQLVAQCLSSGRAADS